MLNLIEVRMALASRALREAHSECVNLAHGRTDVEGFYAQIYMVSPVLEIDNACNHHLAAGGFSDLP
jgi:hypothetical protein